MLETVTPAVLVMMPAAPLPTPKTALYPGDQTLSLEPAVDQFALVVDQLPPPSVGAVGFAPLASQTIAFTRETALKVTVTGLPVVLLNMKANSSNEFTPPNKGMTGLVNTR